MQAKIQALIFRKSREPLQVELFSYCSKGIPGINLIGLGKYANTLKEKLIFLSKEKKINLPLKKYTLCIEDTDLLKDLDFSEVRWLEFPFFLLLSQLSRNVQIFHMDQCYSSGKINMNFTILHPYLEKSFWSSYGKGLNLQTKRYIGEFVGNDIHELDYISSKEVLKKVLPVHIGFEKIFYSKV